ncbi:MAG: phosphoribosylaminoimidazolecarboxamide formyltransferase [Rhodospirillaceae bacterium]|nr:phosphoribosylaminoimidazolecarboxamide formyltransferase [Alphaproteobacteria bacterium]MBR73019.1 phosphoribosylaminoimidazolecarboxamide formyltransferase [Rhodospirillaceae bacterium]
MKNDQRPEPLDELDERLRDARQSQNRRAGLDKPEERLARRQAFRLAGRAGVEIVAGFGFGAAVGWLLDEWLGTWPWLLLLFILLGTAAGMMNTLRVVWKPITGEDLPHWARGGHLSKLGDPDAAREKAKEADEGKK